jgi:hypothetical protein
MRNRLPLLILPAMILAAPASMAQAREGAPQDHGGQAAAGPAAQEETAHRSAFGRVMALMIDALQRQEAQSDARAAPAAAPEVRTTAIGTPIGIEVGGAFRLHAQSQPPESGRTGAADAPMPLAVQGEQAD